MCLFTDFTFLTIRSSIFFDFLKSFLNYYSASTSSVFYFTIAHSNKILRYSSLYSASKSYKKYDLQSKYCVYWKHSSFCFFSVKPTVRLHFVSFSPAKWFLMYLFILCFDVSRYFAEFVPPLFVGNFATDLCFFPNSQKPFCLFLSFLMTVYN